MMSPTTGTKLNTVDNAPATHPACFSIQLFSRSIFSYASFVTLQPLTHDCAFLYALFNASVPFVNPRPTNASISG